MFSLADCRRQTSCSKHLPFLLLPPALYAEYHTIWCIFWVSWSQLFWLCLLPPCAAPASLLVGWGEPSDHWACLVKGNGSGRVMGFFPPYKCFWNRKENRASYLFAPPIGQSWKRGLPTLVSIWNVLFDLLGFFSVFWDFFHQEKGPFWNLMVISWGELFLV